MINRKEVEVIHEMLIEKFGGARGVRDVAILESALGRPYQTFDGTDLYQSPVDNAAAIFESIITNHPFVDGNKRTGYVLMQLILKQHNPQLIATQDEKYNFVIQAAQSLLTYDAIRNWIDRHVQR